MESTHKSRTPQKRPTPSQVLKPNMMVGDNVDVAELASADAQSPADILNIQQTLGNQATMKILNRKNVGGIAVKTPFALQRRTLIQRLPTVDDVQEAVDKDIAKQEEEKKKKELEEEAKKKDEGETPEKKEDKSLLDAVVDSTKDLVEKVVKAVGDIIDKAVYDNLLSKLNEYHDYDAHFKTLDPAYSDHMARLQHIKDVEVASTLFLSTHKEGDPGFARITALKKEAVDAYITASPNAERANQARTELTAKKSADTNSPVRINDELIELMVMSVASPMNESSDKGSAGILGIQSAVDAADAIMMLRQEDYDKIMAILGNSGDTMGDVAKRATLIKALAARKVDLLAAGPQTDKAMQELADFSAEIRDMDKNEMVSKTHAADHGDGQGLQQRFTMSCGPTSIMITKGEFDPIYALKLSKEGKHGLAYDGDIAKEQQGLLEGTNGADTAVPREVEDDWTTTIKAINVYAGTATADELDALNEYLNNELGGMAFDATKAAAGKALTKTVVPGVDVDKRSPEWKKFYSILGNAPGWQNSDFANNAKAKIGNETGRDFNETAIKYKQKLIAGKNELRGEISKHLVPLDEALFRGKSVPLGVMWAAGGGHFMVFTDIKTKKEAGKDVKYYLVSDPWEGTSGWMSKQDLIEGNFDKIGAQQGAIDSIYL